MLSKYQHKVTCSLCGEEGVGTSDCVVAEWTGGFVYHQDPRVCHDNLERQKEKSNKSEK